jgi:hypothetical protein
MVDQFPNIVGIIEEDGDGFIVTAFLLTSPDFHEDGLLIDQPTDTIYEARRIIMLVARQQSIAEDKVVIHVGLTDTRPSKGPVN